MHPKLSQDVINQAIALRRLGTPYTAIAEQLGIGGTAAAKACANVVFTPEEQALIRSTLHHRRFTFGKQLRPGYTSLAEKAVALRRTGLAHPAIATQLGVSTSAVWKYCKNVVFTAEEKALIEQNYQSARSAAGKRMSPRLDQDLTEQAVALRRTGASYNAISQETGIALSSLTAIFRAVEFTEEEKQLILEMQRNARLEVKQKLAERRVKQPYVSKAKLTPEQRAEMNIEKLRQLKLQYKASELELKDMLERWYSCKFKKIMIDIAVVPFASRHNLVLVSRGLPSDHHLVKQFAIINSQQDKRNRYAYLMNTTGVAAKRLQRFNVTVYSTEDMLYYWREEQAKRGSTLPDKK